MDQTQYFLDTNILVHFVREDGIAQHIHQQYSPLLADPRPLISIVTIGELRSLAIQWNWGEQKQDRMRFFLDYFWKMPIEKPEVLSAYPAIDAYSESIGRPMGKNDVWIAASAHVMNTHLLTTDTDFDHLHTVFITRIWIDPERNKKQSN